MHEHEDPERALTGWLRQMAAIDAIADAPPEVGARLLDEVRAIRRARRRTLVTTYAVAAVLLLATALPVWQLTSRSTGDVMTRRTPASSDAEIATTFFPLTYSHLPVTQGNVVRLEVSPAVFAALGVEPVSRAGSLSDVMFADVLVGEDGLARAVRFVRPAANAQEQRP